jgi:hypothetical protein
VRFMAPIPGNADSEAGVMPSTEAMETSSMPGAYVCLDDDQARTSRLLLLDETADPRGRTRSRPRPRRALPP